MNENNCVHFSCLRSTMSFKKPFVAISESTPFTKKYNGFLNLVLIPRIHQINVRQSLFSRFSHRWAGLFSKDALSLLDGHFPHRRFQFPGFQWARDKWVDCRCGGLSDCRIGRRAFCVWLKGGFYTFFQTFQGLAAKFRLTEGREKRWIRAILRDVFMVVCHFGQLRLKHMESRRASVMVFRHVLRIFQVSVAVLKVGFTRNARFAS